MDIAVLMLDKPVGLILPTILNLYDQRMLIQ